MIGTKIYKNNMKDYAKIAIWCNKNNCVIVDKGRYYEVVATQKDIAILKQEKIAELKNARDIEELSPVFCNGYMWDFDDKAQQRINGAIIALGDLKLTWTSADNEEIENVGVDALKAVVGASAMRSNELHIKYRQLREQVEQAESIEEINAIQW